jgi:thiol-disulfide isomerase/thioredoxin
MMNRLVIVFCLLLSAATVSAQENNPLPSVLVETMDGKKVSTQTWGNEGKPIIVSFWALWCKPCLKELGNISEVYDEWQEKTGVKLIAVSIDDARTSAGVRSIVLGNGWEYEIYLDKNSELKRAMNVVNIPHTFLLDGQGRIVWQHTSYAEGDEAELLERIEALAKTSGE